jgi:hypothetical protein
MPRAWFALKDHPGRRSPRARWIRGDALTTRIEGLLQLCPELFDRRLDRADVRPLPIFTIADMNEFRTNDSYVERVVEALYDYLLRINEVRGTGRLYLP